MSNPKILLITRKVDFASNAIIALEKEGYTVTTFTNSQPALQYLQKNPQDLAILDFRVNDMPAPDTLDHMRTLQPGIGVIAAPNHPAVHELKDKHNLLHIIKIPFPLRNLIGVIESSLQMMKEEHKRDSKRPAPSLSSTDSFQTGDYVAAIEFWVSDSETGETVVQYALSPEREVVPDDPTTKVFNKLAAEEPPLPAFSDGSTIREIRQRLTESQQFRSILGVLSDDSTSRRTIKGADRNEAKTDTSLIPAANILETVTDDSTPINAFSLNEFMSRAKESGKQLLAPPSWVQEVEKYMREPEFIKEEMSSITNTFDYTATETAPNAAQIGQTVDDPTNLVTDKIEPIQRSQPPKTLPEAPPKKESANQKTPSNRPPSLPEFPSLDDIDTAQGGIDGDDMSAETEAGLLSEWEVAQHQADLGITTADKAKQIKSVLGSSLVDADDSNPYLTQLALTLTQVSLEVSAEATILAQDGKIIGYAGDLPEEDIEELRNSFADSWEVEDNRAKIRFVTLPSSGKDFLLYSRRTDAGPTLSMIFGGATPMHVIRRQETRLRDALAAVPEAGPIIEEPSLEEGVTAALQVPTDEEIGERTPRTMLWLLRNPNDSIPDAIGQAIYKRLKRTLLESGWQINQLNVQDDFVYIFGDMPVALNAKNVISELMQVSEQAVADKIKQEIPRIWDDGYMVLQPGRNMETEEIQEFINFVRE